ncbi:MAG: flagellar protein FlgN [Gracilibacteraceae bacterium]|nr:flagellar protein FlgN [Gracilibacteraceae bacterium]
MPQDYWDFLENYCDFYEELVRLEEEKMRIIVENKPHLLEGIIKQEEAAVMKAQGLEIKRQELQDAWGAPGRTLREITETAEGADKLRARRLHSRLRGSVETLKAMNQTSADVIVGRLKQIEGVIRELSENGAAPGGSLINRSV